MSLTRSVAKNIWHAMSGRAVFRYLTALAMLYALRYFGAERYGMLEIAIAWSNALMTISDIGLSTLIIREASRDETKAGVYFGNTLLVQAAMSVVLLGVLIGVGFLFNYDLIVIQLIAIIGSAGLIFEFRKVMRSILRVKMNLWFISALEVVNGATFFGIILCIFFFVKDPSIALVYFGIAQLIVNLLSILILFGYTVHIVRPTFDIKAIPSMMKISWVFTLYNIFFMLYFQVDQIMLSIFSTKTAVGLYSAPAKVASVLLFIPMMVYQVLLPLMYKYSTSDPEKYIRITSIAYRYFALIGIPAGAGLMLLAYQLTPFLFGDGYLESAPVMVWMGAFVAVRFLSMSVSDILTSSDKQGTLAGIQIASVCLNIILDILFIPHYGIVGAAVATLITEGITCIAYFSYTQPIIKRDFKFLIKPLIPIAIATALMATVVLLARDSFHVMVVVLFAGITYTLAILALGFFSQEDRKLIRSVFNKS